MFLSLFPSSLSCILQGAVAVLSLVVVSCASAQEGALSQLYAPRPPAGASYVRVVNPLPTVLAVRVAKGPVQRLGGKALSGSYAIVPGGQRFAVLIDGKEVARMEVRPDSFSTLALRRDASAYAFTVIDDTADTEDALKAELRFYNLVAGCGAANLLLSPAGTPVFSAVASSASAARSVNPVRAALVGQCGDAKTAPQPLPQLEPGDHLSLFLTGSATAPQLVIQPSRTDPFTR
jgi:hypothetical protein